MDRLAALDPADYRIPDADLAHILSPALVVYLDKVRHNLARLVAWVGGDADRLRPHIKTAKLPRVFAELAGAGIRHFKCATTREAACLLEALAALGIHDSDLLVAYPHVGPALLALGELARAHPSARIAIVCEDPTLVTTVPSGLGIFVDVNPGMNRTGVPIGDRAAIHAVARAAGPRFRGVHCYEGHVSRGSLAERKELAFPIYQELLDLVDELGTAGARVAEVVTSGTPSFMPALAFERFSALAGTRHRVSPGTVVYFDARSADDLAELDLVPAALVLSRVVSWPTAETVTCDAGSKAIAAEAGSPVAIVLGHPHLHARTPSEEHLPFACLDGTRPTRGTPLYLFPRHVCPTVNLAEEAILMEGGRPIGIAPVAARAHDLLVEAPTGT